jgi:phage tail-like protein
MGMPGGISATETTLTGLNLGMAHRFTVKMGVTSLGSWSKAGGLKVEWKEVQHRPGDVVNGVWWYPGTTQYSKINLERAADTVNTKICYAWLKTISSTNLPQDGMIEMYDSKNIAVMSWVLQGAFPLAWEIDAFDASASKVAIEKLSIVHEGFLMDETKLSGL